MSSLLDDILKYSSLHADYVVESSRKSIFERYSWSEMIINVIIPVAILMIFIFILKKRYVDKQIKIEIARRFKRKVRNNSKG